MKLGLLGWPLSHSKSPKIHNLALSMANMEGSYDLVPVDSQENGKLAAEIQKIRSGEITGFNVTIPYKEEALRYMDRLSPAAKLIGAVNTIHQRDGLVIGDNTDAPGFVCDLKNQGLDLTQKPGEAIVFGAGGSARAILYSLLSIGWQIHLLVRNVEKSREMVNDIKGKGLTGGIKIRSVSELRSTLKHTEIDLVVNTTPLGMFPNVEASPWAKEVGIPETTFVYDLIYNPGKTQLLLQADQAGAKNANGQGMLIEQALLSFEIWTGIKTNRDQFMKHFLQMDQNLNQMEKK